MARLTPDSDTLFLFDLEDFVSGNRNLILDETGNNNLLVTGSSYFVTGPGDNNIRAFVSETTMGKFNVTDSFLTASRGENTIEAWFWPVAGHGDIVFYNGPRGSGESLTTDFTGRYTLNSSNLWEYFSEYGGGLDVNITQTTTNIVNEQWNHVALVRRVTGSNVAMDFYTNGILDETVEQSGEIPGSSAGSDEPNITIIWEGLISSIRFSDTARSGSEISSSANRSDYTHVADGNTVAYWLMDGAPNFSNRGTAPQHLSLATGEIYKAPALVADTTGSITFIAGRTETALGVFTNEVATVLSSSETTIDFWFKNWNDRQAATFCSYGGPGENLNENFLFKLDIDTSNLFTFLGEVDSGVNVTYTTTASLPANLDWQANYFALVQRKDFNNDLLFLDFYINGELFETSSGSSIIRIPHGGTGDTHLVIPGGNNFPPVDVHIQQFRITTRALSAAEISQSYQDGITYAATSDTQQITTFRGLSGSQYVYYTSEETPPEGITLISVVDNITC